MYDEWGNDVGTAPTFFLTNNGEPSPFDVDITPPLSVVSKGEDPLVLPGPTGETSLKLLDDPFVLPGPDSDYGFGLKQGSDDWLVPLSNPGETTLPPLPPVTGDRTQPTTPRFWNPYDGGLDGHDSDPPEPPTEACRSFLQSFNPEGGDYKIPPDFDINKLIAAVNTINSIPVWAIGLNLVQFKNFVGPGGEFDFKVQTSERESYTQADGTIGTRSIYDPIGNWAYGFIAEIAGIQMSAFFAWLNEQFDGDGVGEDPIDQMHIKAGYEAAKRYKESGEIPTERNVYCGSQS